MSSINVLIGSNGVGKSNFIEIFRMLGYISNEKLQDYVAKSGGADKLLHFGHKNTEKLDFLFSFGANKYEFKLKVTDDDGLYFGSETCKFHGDRNPDYEKNLGSGHLESEVPKDAKWKGVPHHVYDAIKGWRVYHFHDTSPSSKIRKSCNINDDAGLRYDASNLAAYLYLLREWDQDRYNNILNVIKLAAPFIHDFILEPNKLNPETIQLEWVHANSDEYFNTSQLSDGTLRFIALATLLMDPGQSTIIIDEPELGLHPSAINLLASMIKSVSATTQIIISTQSVTLVNQFGPEDIVIVERENNETKLFRKEKKDLEEWLGRYGMGDLWEKNLLGGRP